MRFGKLKGGAKWHVLDLNDEPFCRSMQVRRAQLYRGGSLRMTNVEPKVERLCLKCLRMAPPPVKVGLEATNAG